MAETVRLDSPQILRQYAADIAALRPQLERIRSLPHPLVNVLGPAGAVPPGLSQAVYLQQYSAELTFALEAAIGRLTQCASGADRTLGAMAYQAAWAATQLPNVDANNRDRVYALEEEAAQAVPPPPDPDASDPRFASPTLPR